MMLRLLALGIHFFFYLNLCERNIFRSDIEIKLNDGKLLCEVRLERQLDFEIYLLCDIDDFTQGCVRLVIGEGN